MSTYLQLAQKLRRECINGYAGGPTTVLNQTGLMEKVVGWISDSYNDIQLRCPSWRWMRSNFTVNTVAGTDTYAYSACTDSKTGQAISRFACWLPQDKVDPFRLNLTASGVASQSWLRYSPYDNFRRIYKFGVQQTVQGQPIHVSVDDDDQLVLGPNPVDIYTISGSYMRGPQVLAADADIPDMPVRFHDLIVYYAMERYATNSVAPEVLARAKTEGNRLLRALEQSQMPMIRMAGPMA